MILRSTKIMDYNGLHYNSIASYLKKQFGCRVVKLSLDGHFTCPNRDGACGYGGCSFCGEDGSGAFAGTIEDQIKNLSSKWTKDNETVKYIAYFQNHTNTYAPVEYLRKIWDEALNREDIIGIAIATRPDCLGSDVLDLLEEFNKKTFLWVELGLQTANEKTATAFNRGYENEVFELAMDNLSKRGIKAVIHLILGLPGEDRAQMLDSALYACSFNPFGIKLHMLHLMNDTRMGQEYNKQPWTLLSKEEYINIICDILEKTPQNITIHRLTGDAPAEKLIAPLWTRNKHEVLNGIQQEFKKRGTYQGFIKK